LILSRISEGMASLPALDIDLLRSFVLIAEEGNFTRAAERVGRSQSAVSLQVQRLEALVGHRVFVRGKGGVVQLTSHGRYLLGRARGLMSLNDDIVGSLRAQPQYAEIRIGVPNDYLGFDVQNMLLRFSEACPGIAVEVLYAPGCSLVPTLKAGDLDLMVCEAGLEPRRWPVVELWRGRLHWITSERHTPHLTDPLPLTLSPADCPMRPPWLDECQWRGAALRALGAAGRHYRIVATSPELSVQCAAVQAGLAVMVSTLPGLPPGLRPVRPEEGLPELPETATVLLKARQPRQPMTDILAEHVIAAFRAIG
jgi:DNA-binding transcriptional LysR family regulator